MQDKREDTSWDQHAPLSSSLEEIYLVHRGKVSDKWSSYLRFYDDYFTPFRFQRIRLLEIGIQNGGSLEIWAKYFPEALALVGCDIDDACQGLQYDDPRIRIVVGDANIVDTRDRILEQSEAFEIIIDDGSHRSEDIVRSFGYYFPCLAEGGLYIVEDLHCSYWSDFGGGVSDPDSSMSFLKRLADLINHEHWGISARRVELLRAFSEKYDVVFDDASLASIHSIAFLNSLCVIEKAPAARNTLGRRVVQGREAIAEPAPLDADAYLLAPDQSLNPLSDIFGHSNSKLSDLQSEPLQVTSETAMKPLRAVSSKLMENSSKNTNATGSCGGFLQGRHEDDQERLRLSKNLQIQADDRRPVYVQCVYGASHVKHMEAVLIPAMERMTLRPVILFTMNYDGQSTERLVSRTVGQVRIEDVPNLKHAAIGFAEAHNMLFNYAKPENYFVIINPDCIPQASSVDYLVARMTRDSERVAIVEGRQWPHEHPKEYDSLTGHTPWASGAFLLIDSEFYSDVNGMEEAYFLYLEDVDLSWRAWLRNWSVVYEPSAAVTHYSGGPFYRPDVISREQYFGLRNFIALSKKFFGVEGEQNAISMIKSLPDIELAHAAIKEYERNVSEKIMSTEIGRSHPMVKILGINRFHEFGS